MKLHDLRETLTFQALRERYGRKWWHASAWQEDTGTRADLYPEETLTRCDCGLLFPTDGKAECSGCRFPEPVATVARMPERRRG